MSMSSIQLKRHLENRFNQPEYRTSYQRDKDIFRLEWRHSGKGISIKLGLVAAKYNERGKIVLEELEEHLTEALKIMNEEHQLKGMEKNIFPVIRSTSFPKETKRGETLVTTDHTAETRIYYALDLGRSYRLIDHSLLQEENWTPEKIEEIAMFNIRSLPIEKKKDTVQENDFYFIATQDGYDASRILNRTFLTEMYMHIQGEMALAVPHQDVLIVADIRNDIGYDILAQMTMKFFAEGRIPITALPFLYDGKELEPIFIFARNRPKKSEDD